MSKKQFDNIITSLESYNISIDNDFNDFDGMNGFNCYKHNIACGAFHFNNPNENSDCCIEDLMLPNLRMKIRFSEIIKCFGEFNKDDWEHVYDSNNKVLNFNDDREGKFKCICSHNIFELNFLRNKKFNIILLMGSECINKIDSKLAKQKKVCKICHSACFGDCRKQPIRSGFCSNMCKNSYDNKEKVIKDINSIKQRVIKQQKIQSIPIVVPVVPVVQKVSINKITKDTIISFGKFKFKTLEDLLKDITYCNWILTLENTRGQIYNIQKYLNKL